MQRFKTIDQRETVPEDAPCELCGDETRAVVAQIDVSVYGPAVEPTKITYICGNHAEVLDDGQMHFYEANK